MSTERSTFAWRKIESRLVDLLKLQQEPVAPGDPILSLPNVVCSPHNAGQTPEVIRDMEHYLQGKPRDVVVTPVR